ncbi:glutathione S-transferase family protein [Burkholderia perseverans]|uniref:glutathione S-transferase family protein n=1 Tax=Burkholderia perseverans TaxID=2615214 RepID=UPI001FEE68BD|nr:glutathione S-transferase family protein [Burkholderia perseverans]
MKIYDSEGAPNAARIRIVLAAKGLEPGVEFIPVDLLSAGQKQDGYLAKNPIGKIPLLELDDGLVISESTAITEYLDNLDGRPLLTGTTPREKALIHMMQRRVEQLLLEPIDDYFHYGTPGLGRALAPWRMPDWPGRGEWGKRRGEAALRGLRYWDEVLQERAFLAGDTFSMADITLYAALLFLPFTGLQIAPELSALTAWQAKVDALPAVRSRSGQSPSAHDIERFTAEWEAAAQAA